jgi:DNA-binding NarL/FixJ family response regulator
MTSEERRVERADSGAQIPKEITGRGPLEALSSIKVHGRVLVVEDEWVSASDLSAQLESAGYLVLPPALNAAEAMARVSAMPVDVVLVDIHLGGGVDGVELAHQLQTKGDVGVVFVTADVDAAMVERAAAASPLGYLSKPVDVRQLECTVALAMHRVRKRRLERSGPADAEHLSSALLRIGNILQECGVGTQASGRISDEDAVRLRSLTAREWDVLRGLLANQRVPVIARRLGLSPHTVRNHLKAMFRKLGVSSQADLLERLSGAQWERAGV